MIIAIPVHDGRLCLHFGHCSEFARIETDAAGTKITAQTSLKPPAHAPGVLPKWLHEQGVEVVLAGGMGGRARELFEQAGIKVVIGAPAETPETIVNQYLAGTLKTGANTCDHGPDHVPNHTCKGH